jgi:hypothetical protein
MATLDDLKQKLAEIEFDISIAESKLTELRDERTRLIDLIAKFTTHFDSLSSRPECIASYSLKKSSHYIHGRHRDMKAGNPWTSYDSTIDGAKVLIPPNTNELLPWGWTQFWNPPSWDNGNKLVVQYEFMISKAFHEFITRPGSNGRFTDGFKFVNLCPASGAITLEFRTFHKSGTPNAAVWDWRCYRNVLEGRLDRPQFTRDIARPTETFSGSGGGYDWNSGPDASHPWSKTRKPSARTFTLPVDDWIRITYELEKVVGGTRFRAWLSDSIKGPALVTASPANPAIGHLFDLHEPLNQVYFEIDSSQETTYATPQPDRWCGFRNLAVLFNVSGESVLGGKP